jgi:hypothetical protein
MLLVIALGFLVIVAVVYMWRGAVALFTMLGVGGTIAALLLYSLYQFSLWSPGKADDIEHALESHPSVASVFNEKRDKWVIETDLPPRAAAGNICIELYRAGLVFEDTDVHIVQSGMRAEAVNRLNDDSIPEIILNCGSFTEKSD